MTKKRSPENVKIINKLQELLNSIAEAEEIHLSTTEKKKVIETIKSINIHSSIALDYLNN